MPELHSNQIAWQAPELPKANFDSVDYRPLEDAANYLSNVGKDISNKLDAMQDDQLKADLKLAEDRANAIIDEAASADADYEKLSETMLSEVQGAFYKYDEATRTRFNRENKTYFDELQLAVTEKILQKKSKQLVNDVKLNIPLWASEAVAEGTWEARRRGLDKIQKTLKGYATPEEISVLSYEYNNYIDKATLNNLITKNTPESLAKAREYINNPKNVASLDAYELSIFNARLVATEQENAKAKKAAKDPRSLKLIEKYGIDASNGATAITEDMFTKVQRGEVIDVLTQNPDGSLSVEYIDSSDFTSEQREAIIAEFKKLDNLNPNFARDKASFSGIADDVLKEYYIAAKDNSSDQDVAMAHLIEVSENPMFRHLENGTQRDIMQIVNSQLRARVEAAHGENQQMTVDAAEGIPFASLRYDKAIGNPAEILSKSMRVISKGGQPATENKPADIIVQSLVNPAVELKKEVSAKVAEASPDGGRGGIMAKILSDQQNQVNTSPYYYNTTRSVGGAILGKAVSATLPTNKNPYKDNMTTMMLGTADIWRKRFAKDMEDNTLSELGLFHKVLLPAFRDSGLLDGTRFGKGDVTYEKAFSVWCSQLKTDAIYNERTTNANATRIKEFYEILVGDKLTPAEIDRVRTISDWAKSGQSSRDFSDFDASVVTPTRPKTEPVKGSNQDKNYKMVKANSETVVSTREAKALKSAGF